jgi:hypothetical protein
MFGLATFTSLLVAVSTVQAHATFQDLWINGVDQAGKCVRPPASNSPVQSVSTNVWKDIAVHASHRADATHVGPDLQCQRW